MRAWLQWRCSYASSSLQNEPREPLHGALCGFRLQQVRLPQQWGEEGEQAWWGWPRTQLSSLNWSIRTSPPQWRWFLSTWTGSSPCLFLSTSFPAYQSTKRTNVPVHQRSSIPLARDVLTVSELQQGHQLGKLKLIMGTFAGVSFAGDDLTVPELHQDHPHACFLSTSVSAIQRTRVPAY